MTAIRERKRAHFYIYKKQKKAKPFNIKLYLKKVIFLDNCSTMDLFCNSDLVENITKDGQILHFRAMEVPYWLPARQQCPDINKMCGLANML